MTNNNQTRFQILKNPEKSADIIFKNSINTPLVSKHNNYNWYRLFKSYRYLLL
jgi:hypothetical protein